MAERSADWIEQARRDLAHARHSAGGGFYEWACFGAQQAAEKAVKAIFQKAGAEAWGHSVDALLAAFAQTRPVPDDVARVAKELDKAYITTRYPDALLN